MKALNHNHGRAAIAALALAAILIGSSPAFAPETEIPVAEDGRVTTEPAYDGPQITEVRVINEGRYLEIYWDRYVDEEAAVSPANLTLTNGDNTIELQAKPATGPTDTIFFDKDNKQIAATAANSMARLPEDLHLSSVAHTGAIDPDQPLTLTGESSQGLAIEVTGEAVPQAPTPSATPSDESGSDAATATPDPTGTPVAEERVDLPSDIAGQTAAQTTCTKPQE